MKAFPIPPAGIVHSGEPVLMANTLRHCPQLLKSSWRFFRLVYKWGRQAPGSYRAWITASSAASPQVLNGSPLLQSRPKSTPESAAGGSEADSLLLQVSFVPRTLDSSHKDKPHLVGSMTSDKGSSCMTRPPTSPAGHPISL